ncbi:hypothetical protein L6R52_31520 [Myxococcota bacterium]|nr:hypothetical protein [Myxococcota bacterium]
MSAPKSGFSLEYKSARALERDHASSFSQGGMIVPWRSTPPPENTDVTLRITAPDGTRFELAARVGKPHGAAGFLVSFEPAAVDRARGALDTFVRGDRFKRLVDADKSAGGRPIVEPFGALAELLPEDDVTDPGFPAPGELDTEAQAASVESDLPDPSVFIDAAEDTDPGLAALDTSAIVGALDDGVMGAVSTDALATSVLPEIAALDVLDPDTIAPGDADDATAIAQAMADRLERETEARVGTPVATGDVDTSDTPGPPDTEDTAYAEGLDDDDDDGPPGRIRRPRPGDEYLVYVVKYLLVRDFAAIRDRLRSTQQLALELAEDRASVGKVAQLRLTLPGHNVYSMFGRVEAVGATSVTLAFDENDESFRQACLYLETPSARNRLKTEEGDGTGKPQVVRLVEVVPEEDPERMPIRRRLQRMGMEDKINLALSGGREERMALALDGNKAIHHYLLRNAKISLDEIAFMARLPTMNPDVLDKIAENPAYTQNPTVVKALVYNPKTPVPTAIRLLDRLPRNEVMNLAKRASMNMRLVMAAKKKLESRRV